MVGPMVRRTLILALIVLFAFLGSSPTVHAATCDQSAAADVVTDKSVYAIGEPVTITMCVGLQLPAQGDLIIGVPDLTTTTYHIDFGSAVNPSNVFQKSINATRMGEWTVSFSAQSMLIAQSISSVVSIKFKVEERMPVYYEIQVGASGNNASIGNIGVAATIRTHVYTVNESDFADAFWVGDNLDNGAIIQFGYMIYRAGVYCLDGQFSGGLIDCAKSYEAVSKGDARWFWQYRPYVASEDVHFRVGPTHSAGGEGDWLTYGIMPNATEGGIGGWAFLLNNQTVDTIPFQWTHSSGTVHVAAEKLTFSKSPRNLGPVGFKDISYLTADGWQKVTALYALRGCGVDWSECEMNNPFGVQGEGWNEIAAGTGKPGFSTGVRLWAAPLYSTLNVQAPPNATVIVDGTVYNNSVRLVLRNGVHRVTVPLIIPLNESYRLRFISWSDGSKRVARDVQLSANTSLNVRYGTQILITANPMIGGRVGEWSDEGNTLQFSAPSTTAPIDGWIGWLGGRWVFVGWYEADTLVSDSTQVSVSVDGPHSLVGRWRPDVIQPVVEIAALILVLEVLVYREISRRLRHVSTEDLLATILDEDEVKLEENKA